MPKTKSTATPRKAASKKAPTEVTSASAWRSRSDDGHVVTLPSGNVARLRRTLNLSELLKAGKIPNPLADIVKDVIGQKKNLENSLKDEDNGEAVIQMLQLMNRQMPRIFVEPKVQVEPKDWDEDEQGLWEPEDGYISVHDIDPEDRLFVFAFAQGGPSDVASFREGSEKALAGLADESGVVQEAE